MFHTRSGMLLSYRLDRDCAWYAAIFVVVYGPGLVHQRVQRGAVGLGRCRYALACIRWCSKCQVVVFDEQWHVVIVPVGL